MKPQKVGFAGKASTSNNGEHFFRFQYKERLLNHQLQNIFKRKNYQQFYSIIDILLRERSNANEWTNKAKQNKQTTKK